MLLLTPRIPEEFFVRSQTFQTTRFFAEEVWHDTFNLEILANSLAYIKLTPQKKKLKNSKQLRSQKWKMRSHLLLLLHHNPLQSKHDIDCFGPDDPMI